jgi:phage terminase large subunit GpA-like protein
MRVFVNKVLGDVFEPKVKQIDIDNLRSVIVVRRRPNDREFYSRGTVPPAVVFLTGGQDSRSTQLHHVVWGWGVRIATDKTRWLCGWLIDWGEIERKYSLLFNDAEYHIYDDLIYRRRFKSTIANASYHVRSCAHDIGYQPTQMPIIRYCRSWPGRAVPARGASETPTSATKADYVRMGAAKRFNAGEAEQIDDPAMLINTYLLKEQWYSWVDQRIEIDEFEHGEKVGTRKVPRLSLPEDVDETWLEQSKNEKLARGKRPRELVWVKSGPNHLADCNTYAFGCAMYLEPHMGNMTAEEFRQTQMVRRRASYSRPSERPDPSMG